LRTTLAVDPQAIYVANPTGDVTKVDRSGGPSSVFTSAQSKFGVALNGSVVYWTDWVATGSVQGQHKQMATA
jgi:hypothetical protein